MIETLLEEAFEKAGVICGKNTINARSVFLAELLTEEYKCPITDKSLGRYYKKQNIPKKEVLDGLAQFLEFRDYEDYVKTKDPDSLKPSTYQIKRPLRKEKPEDKERYKKKLKGALILLLGLILGTGSYQAFVKDRPDCIRWMGEQYEAVNCSGDALDIPYRQDLLDDFRKVKVADTTQFFVGGKPRIWYMKSGDQLEYFNAPGLHPVNGKTLRPITPYMIDKYVMGESN